MDIISIILGIVAVVIAVAIILVVGMVVIVAIIGAIAGAMGGALVFAIGALLLGADVGTVTQLGAILGAIVGAIGTPIHVFLLNDETRIGKNNSQMQSRRKSALTVQTEHITDSSRSYIDFQAIIEDVTQEVQFSLDANLESIIDSAVEIASKGTYIGRPEYLNEYEIQEHIEDEVFDIIRIESGRFAEIDVHDEIGEAIRLEIQPQINSAIEQATNRYQSSVRRRRSASQKRRF